jgi:hypothetical protein
MTLKIGGDGIARFPWSREMWFAGKADYEIKACVEQQGVNDRNDSGIWTDMRVVWNIDCFHESFII